MYLPKNAIFCFLLSKFLHRHLQSSTQNSNANALHKWCHMRQIEIVITAREHQLFDGDLAQRLLFIQLQWSVIVFQQVEHVL